MKFSAIENQILSCFPEAASRDIGEYSCLTYPKGLHLLRMDIRSYELPDFGYLMCMNTSMMGMMKLATFSLTPSSGVSMPYLLIDTMSMGKKRLAYVELYDCRQEKTRIPELEHLSQKYLSVEDYEEKPAWYISERMTGSLIKCAAKSGEDALGDMIADALQVYASEVQKAGSNPENIAGLETFADRMIREGNPSSNILNKILGREKAEAFFRQVVMPMENPQ